MHARAYALSVVLLLLMASWPSCKQQTGGLRTAAAQGLSVGSDNMGAGAEATATEFELFEDSLHLSTTGGKGRGGRGGQQFARCKCCSTTFPLLLLLLLPPPGCYGRAACSQAAASATQITAIKHAQQAKWTAAGIPERAQQTASADCLSCKILHLCT
jgi:hypothetical protein